MVIIYPIIPGQDIDVFLNWKGDAFINLTLAKNHGKEMLSST